ncbi:MAG: class I SAM-dependent methyltransferase [Gammaproteobacteria bacterium]|nr:class I SAM-dependent methyltransferase [Gammaproteobacteria bacterium]
MKRRAFWSFRRGEIQPLEDSCVQLGDWFCTNLGREILAQQLSVAQPLLEACFGYHLMQVSVTTEVDFSICSRINHCFQLSACAGMEGAAQVEAEQLPLPAESIDVVVLHHLLDFSANPHQVLREAARVLIPGGHILLIGFNPFSLLGLTRLLQTRSAYQQGNQLRAARVADWMKLLDLQAIALERGFFRLPLQQRELLAKTLWMERIGARWRLPWGGFYIIVARKEVARMRAIKIDWRADKKPILTAVPSSPRAVACQRKY